MFTNLLSKIFSTSNERYIKKIQPLVNQINALEAETQQLSDADLKGRTQSFRDRLANGETIDALLPEAFATAREASKRTLGMRHFDVQLVGGYVLHKGNIAEMRTGEGKTLVATLSVYLNALEGKGVHLVTVNDYLARRDAEWMRPIYEFLGLSVGIIQSGLNDEERKAAYACDVTYGTNNEFGFDYLRDNMKFEGDAMVQRPFHYAIVDEVDSILIDEARTPLIISGPTEDSSELYKAMNKIIPKLAEEDYEKDEKARSITFTEVGTQKLEELLQKEGMLESGELYDIQNVSLVHHANQALKAHKLFHRDVDYIVNDNKVVIIDEFTGRMMEGRRFSEGLHQALEAKENAHIEMENQTLASITFQNYFRLYPKLAGMTGTAATEAAEFGDIYGLEVTSIPTNKPAIRIDHDDEVYRTAQERYDAVIALIKQCHERKQPVLVGTVSIEKSEYLAALLKKNKIPHNVLNARYHEQEAFIIAQAGEPGAVTVATNMAGRGTDIKLGGNLEMRLEKELTGVENPDKIQEATKRIEDEIAKAAEEVKAAGGLYVIGTERHESRRIDNQLRGRAGRQGDPAASKFFLSLEDDLMRIFGSDRLDSMLQRLGLEEGEAITHPWVSKALERAQIKVEARNYEIRKHLLKYDDVMNDQRKVIYELRRDLMTSEDAKDIIEGMRLDVIDDIVTRFIPHGTYSEQWEVHAMHEECMRLFGLNLPISDWVQEEGIADEEVKARITRATEELLQKKEERFTPELMRVAEKSLLLRILDTVWKDHLHSLDHLRQGINLRAYAQRDPLNEYKSEAFNLFEAMLGQLRETVTGVICHFNIDVDTNADEVRDSTLGKAKQKQQGIHYGHPQAAEQSIIPGGGPLEEEPAPASMAQNRLLKREEAMRASPDVDPSKWGDVKRNAPCPCGSGLRYKHCHGKV
jgi:preprotein translocase subunit SecA